MGESTKRLVLILVFSSIFVAILLIGSHYVDIANKQNIIKQSQKIKAMVENKCKITGFNYSSIMIDNYKIDNEAFKYPFVKPKKGHIIVGFDCTASLAIYNNNWCAVNANGIIRIFKTNDSSMCVLKEAITKKCLHSSEDLGGKLDLLVETIFENNFFLKKMPSLVKDEKILGDLQNKVEIISETIHREFESVIIKIDDQELFVMKGKYRGFPEKINKAVLENEEIIVIIFNDKVPDNDEYMWLFKIIDNEVICREY